MAEVEPVTLKSVWELIRKTLSSWSTINAPRLGAALAYYTVLSMAPLLVVCIGIAGMVFGAKAAEDQIAYQIQNVVGPQGGQVIQALLAQSGQHAQGLTSAIIGFVVLLFGASGVFGELRDSLNLVWGVESTSGAGLMGMLRYRFFSFAMVLAVGFLLLVSLVLSAAIAAAGKFFAYYLPAPEPLLHVGNLVFSFLVITVVFGLLYKVVPDVQIQWRDVWIGAGVTSLLFSIGKFLIGLYLGKASVGSAYGAAGSLVVFLVWVYYSAQVFLMGAEFTHVFAERHGSRAEERAEVGPAATEQDARKFRHPKLA
jgi:membrane protein